MSPRRSSRDRRRTPPAAPSPTCWPRGATSTSRSGRSRRGVTTRAASPGSSPTLSPRCPSLVSASPTSSGGTRGCARRAWGRRRSAVAIPCCVPRSLRHCAGSGWEATRRARPYCANRSVSRAMRMTADDVRAAIAAAHDLDPAAGVALRLAAVAGLRRAELAALQWTDLAGNQLTVDSSATIVRRDGESWVEDVATKTGDRRTLTLDPATVDAIDRAARRPRADLALPVLGHDRARQPRSHRMVVDPSPRAIRHRPQVASSRSAALDRDHRDHEWARRADRRRPPRPRQPGDDAAGLRPRGGGCGPSARG